MSDNSERSRSAIRKTRNRVPTSCESCRKRKLKCDRRRPCWNCMRSHREDQCKYVSPPTNSSPKTKLTNEIIQLKMRIKKMEQILKMNKIDPSRYTDLSSLLSSEGMDDDDVPDLEDDPIVSLSGKFDRLIIKGNRILHSGTTTYMTIIYNDPNLRQVYEKYFQRHQMNFKEYERRIHMKASQFPDGCIDSRLALLSDTNSVTETDVCNLVNLELSGLNKASGSVHGPVDAVSKPPPGYGRSTVQVIDAINLVMPPMYAVNALIDYFFYRVYPIVPFVDEDTFRTDIKLVLVGTRGGGCRVAITHVQNASVISLLLIVLRFGYLGLNARDLSEDPKLIDNASLIEMIRTNVTVDPDMIDLARNLIMSVPGADSIFKKVTMRNIQVLLLLRLYQGYAPELNEESHENAINLSMIIEMVRVIGSNRDPSRYPTMLRNERENVISRRVFYELLRLDAMNSYMYGCPLIMHDSEIDVELPKLTTKEATIFHNFKEGKKVGVVGKVLRGVFVEKYANRTAALGWEATKLLREGVNTFQNVSEGTRKSKLVSVMHKLERFLDEDMPSLTSLTHVGQVEKNTMDLNTIYRVFQIPTFRVYEMRLCLNSILVSYCYLLYLNEDEGMNEDKVQYAVKATENALINIKAVLDYTQYYTESETLNGHTQSHIENRKFSQKLESFVMVRAMGYLHKPLLWMFSTFLSSASGGNELDFRTLLSGLSSHTDSLMVLNWFNMDLNDTTNEQYLFMLFHYLKQMYFLCFQLRDQFFACWRTSVTIKLFINFFKNSDEMKFKKFTDPSVIFNIPKKTEPIAQPAQPAPPAAIMDQQPAVSQPEAADSNETAASLGQIAESDLTALLATDNSQNVNQILSTNFDTAIDEIMKETEIYSRRNEDFSIFGNTTGRQDLLFPEFKSNGSDFPTKSRLNSVAQTSDSTGSGITPGGVSTSGTGSSGVNGSIRSNETHRSSRATASTFDSLDSVDSFTPPDAHKNVSDSANNGVLSGMSPFGISPFEAPQSNDIENFPLNFDGKELNSDELLERLRDELGFEI